MANIPKIIHYCWFGDKPIPKHLELCINSWKTFAPDFEFRKWDNDSIVTFSNPFVHEALKHKKYAFVADVARFYALYNIGGVYLDTDYLLLKPLESFLHYNAFLGLNDKEYPEFCIIGSKPNFELWNQCIKSYENLNFDVNNLSEITVPIIVNKIIHSNSDLELPVMFNYKLFYSYPFWAANSNINYGTYILEESVGIHLWDTSWWGEDGKIFNLFWKREYLQGFKRLLPYILKNPFRGLLFYKKVLYHLKRFLLRS